jgi:hypothetical protein
MQESYLIQRLELPYEIKEIKTPIQALAKFGFSATGLKKEALDVLSEICIFDYMGSAEYEFGAIPKALARMASNKNLIESVKNIEYSFCAPFSKNGMSETGERIVYIIYDKTTELIVVERIKAFALGKEHTKERTQFNEALASYKYAKNIVGWFDLDNAFMFFCDREMFKDFAKIFGLKIGEEKNAD